jgi:hypothetical protein
VTRVPGTTYRSLSLLLIVTSEIMEEFTYKKEEPVLS